MLIIPFFGLIVSLTLWGTFLPVPFTNINPHESFVGRLSGAFKTAYVATGTYELVQTVSIAASDYGHGVVDDYPVINDTSFAFDPTPTWEGTQFVYDLRTVEPVEPSRTTSGGVGSDSTEAPVASSRGIVMFVVVALVLLLIRRMGLVSNNAHTLSELAEELDRKLFGPAKVAYYLEIVDPTEVSLDSIVAMVEQSQAPVEGGIASFYPSCDSSMFTHSLAYRPPPQPCQDLVLFQRPVFSPVVREDGLTFHHAADEAISCLVRLQGDEDVKDLGFCIPAGEDTIPEVAVSSAANKDPASADVTDFDSAHLPQTKALVLFRLENLSHFVVYQLVCALLASWESHTTAVPDPTPVDDCALDQQVPEASEVGSETEEAPKTKRKNRTSKKLRHRRGRAAMREKQAVLVAKLEEESSARPSLPSPPPEPAPVPVAQPPPIPEPSVEHAPKAPKKSKSKLGQGRLSRPPNLPPPPKRQQRPPPPAPRFVISGGPPGPVQPPPPPSPAASQKGKPVVRLPPASQAQGQGRSVPPVERGLYMHPNSRYRPS